MPLTMMIVIGLTIVMIVVEPKNARLYCAGSESMASIAVGSIAGWRRSSRRFECWHETQSPGGHRT
jgi:hypothetical protein